MATRNIMVNADNENCNRTSTLKALERVPYKVGNSINTIANFVKLCRPFDIFTKKLFCNISVSNHHGQKHNDEEEAAGAHFNVC